MKRAPESRSVSRRELLVRLSAAGVVAAGATALPRAAVPTGSRAQAVTVFRLRTRDTLACRACEIHHRYKIFVSFAAADRNRAHPGCNCPITKQKLQRDLFHRLFIDSGAIQQGVVDLRSGAV